MPLERDQNDHYMKQLSACSGRQIVLVVLMNNRLDRYSAIKKYMSCTLAVPTQVIYMFFNFFFWEYFKVIYDFFIYLLFYINVCICLLITD